MQNCQSDVDFQVCSCSLKFANFAKRKVLHVWNTLGWQFGVAVMRWSRSTQLLYIEPG